MYNQDHRNVIAKLAMLFPKAFFENPKLRVPLKQNIISDIEKMGCNELLAYDVGAAVDFYITHIGYQICLSIPGRMRVDLNGKAVARVTPDEAAVAQQKANDIGQSIRVRKTAAGNLISIVERRDELLVEKVKEQEARDELDFKRAKASETELLDGAMRKLARASSLLESEDDEFKPMFLRTVLKETKADIEALLKVLK
jgi:sRNA-binding protein